MTNTNTGTQGADTVRTPEGQANGTEQPPVVQQVDEASQATATDTTGGDNEAQGKPGNKEAAKYRVRLRELEGDHAKLQARFDATADSLATVALGKNSISSAALRKMGVDLNAMVTDQGTIDADQLYAAAAEVSKELGVDFRDPRRGEPVKGSGYGSSFNPVSWSTAIGR